LGAPLAAALAASLISQQFVVFIVPTALSFYLLLALLIALETGGPQRAEPRTWWYPPLAWITAAVLAMFAIRLLAADASLARADRRIATGDAAGAAQSYRSVLRWQPAGSGSDLRYARAMQQLSTHASSLTTSLLARQEAFKAGIDATRTAEDRQNAWYNLATLFAANNDAISVEHSLRNAIAWAPNWFKPHWTLAQVLEATNRHSLALKEAAMAADLDNGHDPEVAETLKKLENVPRTP
jgi:hypothetical protein